MNFKKNNAWKPPRIGRSEIRLLEKLSNACSVSGNEDEVRKIVLDEIKPYIDEKKDDLKVDVMGNILLAKNGRKKDLPRVLLAAHMDEIGFMLISEDSGGLFRFELVGGVDKRHLVGKPVWVGNKHIPGVIGAKPIHLTSHSERSRAFSLDSLRIDIGEENKQKASPGDWATFATNFSRVGPSLVGKALDDRVGVASLITLIKNPPDNIHLLAAFTVQEEVGLRGARVAAYTLDPDIAFALDCTPAMDMPTWDDSENTLYRTKLDLGPAIYIADAATSSDPRLVNLLKLAGDTYNIPYQLRQPGGGGTDAGAIHLQRKGIPSVSVSVPCRYLHTSASMIRLKDWRNFIQLVHASLSHLDKNLLKAPR
jgi:endoglucanase